MKVMSYSFSRRLIGSCENKQNLSYVGFTLCTVHLAIFNPSATI